MLNLITTQTWVKGSFKLLFRNLKTKNYSNHYNRIFYVYSRNKIHI